MNYFYFQLYNFFNDMMLQLELAASCGENESRRNVITAMSLLKRKTQGKPLLERSTTIYVKQ